MTLRPIRSLLLATLCPALPLGAQSISVNFRVLGGTDANSVDPGEFATVHESVDGQFWNNLTVRESSAAGPLTTEIDGATLIDDTGNPAATLSTPLGAGDGYAGFGGTSSPSQSATGEGGLMQSYLNFGGTAPAETLTISGLGSAFTSDGYTVRLFFDLEQARTYGFTVNDGTASATVWTADSVADADSDNDGVIEWVEATGTSEATATPNANHAVISGLTGSSFTISGLCSNGRATLNGLQVVAGGEGSGPFPATGKSISLNLFNLDGDADANRVDAGESAGYFPVAGEHWNHIGFNGGSLSGGAASATRTLADENGDDAALFQSTLTSAYVGFSGARGGTEGDRNLMSSYLAFATGTDTGQLRLSGLPASITGSGYRVLVYFDTDSTDRIHTLTLTPDGGGPLVLAGDDSGTFEGSFVPAAGAGSYANLGIFENLTSSAFNLEMASSVGRAAVNGIQIISNELPLPPTIASLRTNDAYVEPGTVVTLSWETTGATALTLNPGGIDLIPLSTDGDGSTAVTVDETTTYTLTATNGSGSATADLRVGAGPPKPNILLFVVDDMGWQDTSLPFHYDASGNPVRAPLNDRYRTPNMEDLATRGMMFTNAYSCSVCTPTRASIMTGMNSARHHITNWTDPSSPRKTDTESDAALNPPDWRISGIDAGDITLPRLLQQAGYRTIHAGKAHFAPNATDFGDPTRIGFDVNIAGHGAGGPGSYWGEKNYSAVWRGGGTTWDVPGLDAYHGTDTFLSEALTLEMNKAIESAVNDGVPFFAYMAHYAVHAPFEADSRFTANYPGLSGDALAFATLVEGMDKSLGDILAKLDDLDIAGDTLVIFTSDNGTPIGSLASLQTLRNYKGTRHEGGMRVPFMAAWAAPDPANEFQQVLPVPQNSREDDIIACWDLFPTIAGIAGGEFSHDIDGHDLRPYFRAEPGSHRPQEFLMHFPNGHSNDYFSVFRQDDWKLILNYGSDSYELYNLATDIGETNNLAAADPGRVMAMARGLARRLDDMGAQYPVQTSDALPHPPLMPDSPALDLDGDGLPDIAEDPNRNGLVDPGETDPDNDNSDGDNIGDGHEARLGLDPLDPNSFFSLHCRHDGGNRFELVWPSLPGAVFDIRFSADLSDWSTLLSENLPADDPGTETRYTADPGQGPKGFFRVEFK